MHTTRVWNVLHLVLSQKIGKPNNSKVFGSKKTKGHKQDRQNQLTAGTLLTVWSTGLRLKWPTTMNLSNIDMYIVLNNIADLRTTPGKPWWWIYATHLAHKRQFSRAFYFLMHEALIWMVRYNFRSPLSEALYPSLVKLCTFSIPLVSLRVWLVLIESFVTMGLITLDNGI